jgi:hypothetical protein
LSADHVQGCGLRDVRPESQSRDCARAKSREWKTVVILIRMIPVLCSRMPTFGFVPMENPLAR